VGVCVCGGGCVGVGVGVDGCVFVVGWVGVCSLSYTAFTTHAPYCRLSSEKSY
jgi:hypothetical protein